MLLSITIENWMSFRDAATFSMVASREHQHRERTTHLKKYGVRLLPVAAFYGGNASGKSNFFKALRFARDFVVEDTKANDRIPVIPFLLASNQADHPSRFYFQILIDETIYEFGFSITKNEVIEEKLVRVTGTSERILYHRTNGKIDFDKSLNQEDRLHFVFLGTRKNQLFLTNCMSQQLEHFAPIYNWFENTLVLISPDASFNNLAKLFTSSHPQHDLFRNTLSALDTGISGLTAKEVLLTSLPMAQGFEKYLNENLLSGDDQAEFITPNESRIVFQRANNQVVARKLITYHSNGIGQPVEFDISQESDGTKRCMDILPAFIDLANTNVPRVYVIDELDRSLHTLLTRRLLESFLSVRNESSRSQLLFTTHDVLLMDQRLLRRDEMWIVERDFSGSSTLFSFSDYKDVRKDKDIRKSYLQGRLGGIPRILAAEALLTPAEIAGGAD